MSDYKTKLDGKELFIISLPPSITTANTEAINTDMKQWAESTASVFVLDFAGVVAMASSAYRSFLLLNQTLKKNGKTMVCVNCNKTMTTQFKVDGLLSVFMAVGSLDEARKIGRGDSGKPATINVEFIEPFILAAQSALKVQANTDSKPGKPHMKHEKYPYEIGIAGVISLVSDGFTGSIALCFPAKVFLKVYENLVGEPADSITPEIQDAAGELLNIIFGQAKTVLNDKKGYKISKAIPTVLVGDHLKIQAQNRSQTMVLPFETSFGPFHIEVSLQPESMKAAA